jgi:two-component system, OmpR family, copper resistance phosphate regulon response regulator CusR
LIAGVGYGADASMKVLVIEDSDRMARSLQKGLGEEGYVVELAGDGPTGLRLARSGDFDLVLLDLNLPGMDGLELVRELRKSRSDVPVVMVTARDSVEDRIAGLDGGADDYIAKPFSFSELLARVRAVMRRPGTRTEAILRHADIELDPASGRASRGGKPLELSAREFALLRAFMRQPGHILGRAQLYEAVWGDQYDGLSNVLDVYVNYLRNKLEAAGGMRVIHTVRGRGYVFGEPAK